MKKWGLQASALTDALRQQYSIDGDVSGVVITSVDQTSQAAAEGIQEGDVVEEINKNPITNIKDFTKALKAIKNGDNVMFLIRRGESTLYTAFTAKFK